ncbi:MAG: acyl carrier protein [Candidatus Izemoplasmatales bacterium]
MIFEELKELISNELGVKEEDINMDSNLVADLGADSLDAVELIMTIEDQFGITVDDKDAQSLQTVRQIVEYIENNQ